MGKIGSDSVNAEIIRRAAGDGVAQRAVPNKITIAIYMAGLAQPVGNIIREIFPDVLRDGVEMSIAGILAGIVIRGINPVGSDAVVEPIPLAGIEILIR